MILIRNAAHVAISINSNFFPCILENECAPFECGVCVSYELTVAGALKKIITDR